MRHGRARAIHLLLALIALAIVAPSAESADRDRRPVYYLALGDSLSRGVQAVDGVSTPPTDQGYVDLLHAHLRASSPNLELVQLGCPVTETTRTMLRGNGTCDYERGSQLADAVAFLRENRGSVALVTIDIGANDIEPCAQGADIDDECVKKAFIQVASHLPPILAALRVAAGPRVPIVGMNYYNPFLAAWLVGATELAEESAEKLAAFNGLLKSIYRFFRMPVADVAGAFQSDDFETLVPTPIGTIPLNVATICQLTSMCPLPPTPPNIHANGDGYARIAEAFLEVLPD